MPPIGSTTWARRPRHASACQARLGLNQRPLRCQRSALPLSYAQAVPADRRVMVFFDPPPFFMHPAQPILGLGMALIRKGTPFAERLRVIALVKGRQTAAEPGRPNLAAFFLKRRPLLLHPPACLFNRGPLPCPAFPLPAKLAQRGFRLFSFLGKAIQLPLAVRAGPSRVLGRRPRQSLGGKPVGAGILLAGREPPIGFEIAAVQKGEFDVDVDLVLVYSEPLIKTLYKG